MIHKKLEILKLKFINYKITNQNNVNLIQLFMTKLISNVVW